jgi:hypothetical protein
VVSVGGGLGSAFHRGADATLGEVIVLQRAHY